MQRIYVQKSCKSLHMFKEILCIVLFFAASYSEGLPSTHEAQRGPTFFNEPPTKVEFHNDTGGVVVCSAQGHPTPLVSWVQQGGAPLGDVSGIRHTRSDGALVFPPFSAEDYRQGVHDTVYRCMASNSVGTIISREVHVKAVVKRRYKVQVYDEFVLRGNTAVLKCQVPSFVEEYVTFTWRRSDGVSIANTSNKGGRYSILPTGELYIRGVTQADGQTSYSCQARHRLTGDVTTSATAGSIFVTEPHGSSSPKIIDIRPMISANEGETLELGCAATAYPPPSYRWYKEEHGQFVPTVYDQRITLIGGSLLMRYAGIQDSGRYMCAVNNTAGEDRQFTLLSISAPLSVHVQPQRQIAEVGRPATFNCSASGRPIRSLSWTKDGRPLRDGRAVLLSGDVLHIPAVQRDDRGMYQCFAVNDRDSAQGTAELRLGDVAPQLLSTFSPEAVRPGASVSLRCSASGNPLPQITWFVDDISIPEAVRFRVGDYVTSDGHVMSYVNVSDVRTEDGGEYACAAENAVTSVRHAARLDVFGPPHVKLMPNASVVAGRTAELRCPTSGYPIREVLWKKDGVALPVNHRQTLEPVGKLFIQDVQRSQDEGYYSCEAFSPDDKKAEGKMHMRVLVAPSIETGTFPETLYVKEGAKAKVMCSITQGDPPVQIAWRKNGFPLPIEKDLTLQNFDDSSLLIFRKVTSGHTGNYTCFASNAADVVNRTIHIIVNVPPRWKIEPTNKFAVVGKAVMADCVAEGYPTPRIYWKKATGSSGTDFRDVLSSYRRQVLENGSLSLQEVQEADGGRYLCQAANGIGTGLSKLLTLTVHTPPRFESKFVSHTIQRGKEAELRCEAVGELPIKFEWEKDKQSLDPANIKRLSAIEENGSSSAVAKLHISAATRSDSALYTCTATNKFGNDQTNIQLVVQEPPSPPVDLRIVEKSSRSVVLQWAQSFSGNSPITRYTIQFTNTTKSTPEGPLQDMHLQGQETSSSVRDLAPATAYRLRVVAHNALGESEPSEFVDIITEEEVPGGPPLDVSVQPTGSQSLKVTWKEPHKNLQYGSIHGYYIGYKIADSEDSYQYKNVESTGGQELSYLTNLHRLTKYNVIVQAYNRIGAGPRSDAVVATTLEAAPPTSPVVSIHSVTSSTVTVTWDRPLEDRETREYILNYRTEGGSDKYREQRVSTSGNQYTLSNLRCGTGYRLYMMAVNSLGKGEPSDLVTARTQGAAPVSPQKDVFLSVNSTSVTLHLDSWQSGGCPIRHFSVHFRLQGHWKAVSERVDPAQIRQDIRHLAPGREYTLRVSAHSDAGTTEAEYRFITLNTTTTYSVPKGQPSQEDGLIGPIYKNLTVLLPVVVSVVVLCVVVIAVIVCLRKQVDTASVSEDGRKRCNSEHLGLNEFPAKANKEADAYGAKSSYYSSPARKPMALASGSQRDHLETNHEYAEPYCTVPAPRCLLDESPLTVQEVLAARRKSEGHYTTCTRSPSRKSHPFIDVGQVVDMRGVQPMSCLDRQELCNNSSSSQSGASEGYKYYRQDIS